MRISDKISDAEFFRRKAEEVAISNRDRLIGFSVDVRPPKAPECVMTLDGVPHRFVADGQTVNFFPLECVEKLSLTGANEHLCGIIHRALCRLSPINGLANHVSALAQLSPMDVVQIAAAITHPAVQSGDVAGIMAMRVPPQATETAIPEDKASPQGLSAMTAIDHRLGAWK